MKAKEVYSERIWGNMSMADKEPGLNRRQWLLMIETPRFRRGGWESRGSSTSVQLGASLESCPPGAHNLKWAIAMRSCHDVFTDQFIFRTILAPINNIFQVPQMSHQN